MSGFPYCIGPPQAPQPEMPLSSNAVQPYTYSEIPPQKPHSLDHPPRSIWNNRNSIQDELGHTQKWSCSNTPDKHRNTSRNGRFNYLNSYPNRIRPDCYPTACILLVRFRARRNASSEIETFLNLKRVAYQITRRNSERSHTPGWF